MIDKIEEKGHEESGSSNVDYKLNVFKNQYEEASYLIPKPPLQYCSKGLIFEKEAHKQDFYHCYTYQYLHPLHAVICSRCAQNCHYFHDIKYVGKAMMNCNCDDNKMCNSNKINKLDQNIQNIEESLQFQPLTFQVAQEEKVSDIITINYTDFEDSKLPYLQCYIGDAADEQYLSLLDTGCSQSFISWDILVTIPQY